MNQRHEDESEVVDLLLGQLEKDKEEAVRQRVSQDKALGQLRDDVANTLAAIKLLPEAPDREDLAARTLARIRQDQQIKALIARQEARPRRGISPMFSLREVGALIAASVLLAVVFIPTIRQARHTSQVNECASQMGQIGAAMAQFANANNDALPLADSPTGRWLPGTQNWCSNSSALFKLVKNKYATPPLFQCPAVGGESFQVQAGMGDFPARKYVSYSLHHSVGNKPLRQGDRDLGGQESQMAILADSSPVFSDGVFHPQRVNDAASDNHKDAWPMGSSQAGQNVLYLDWHVAWAQTPNAGIAGDNIFLAGATKVYNGDEAPTSAKDSFLLPAYCGCGE